MIDFTLIDFTRSRARGAVWTPRPRGEPTPRASAMSWNHPSSCSLSGRGSRYRRGVHPRRTLVTPIGSVAAPL
jgi:hypothetical protein